MEKNWLIRTTSNQILGPIKKDKLKELLSAGSLKAEDEVCSGNGYWFSVNERDLVEKYLTGSELQNFSIISESKDVLTADSINELEQVKEEVVDDASLDKLINELPDVGDNNAHEPTSEDLEYPDITVILPSNNLDKIEKKAEKSSTLGDEVKFPEGSDLEYPELKVVINNEDEKADNLDFEIETDDVTIVAKISGEELVKEEKVTPPRQKITDRRKPKKSTNLVNFDEDTKEIAIENSKFGAHKPKKDFSLLYLVLVLAILLGIIVYYYKNILNKPIPFIGSNLIFSSAHAQNVEVKTTKKKIFFH
jgi:hypothetical protein